MGAPILAQEKRLREKRGSGEGAGNFEEEVAELGGIFFAGAGLDAAGDVDGVGTNDADGLCDIFGGQATGKDDAMTGRGATRCVPIDGAASTAELLRSGAIEQECANGGKFAGRVAKISDRQYARL